MSIDIQIRKECIHKPKIVERIFDAGFYQSSYILCQACASKLHFQENMIEEISLKQIPK